MNTERSIRPAIRSVIPPAIKSQTWLATGLITCAVVVAYFNSFSGALVYDDRAAITENASIRQLWPLTSVLSPPAEAGTGGRPFANLTFGISYALSGIDPWGYHLLNVGIHLLTALTLLGVVRRTLARVSLAPKLAEDSLVLATVVALIWAVHPLQTQTVTYLSQRTEGLMALFYLLALYCFIRGSEKRPEIWFSLSVAAGLLGVLSKEVIATLPVIILLYDRTFVAGSFRLALKRHWKLYAAMVASWIPLLLLLQGVKERGVGYGLGLTWYDYALTECKAVLLYLKLILWPEPLVFDRGVDLVRATVAAAPWVLSLTALLAVTVWALKKYPAFGFCGAFFFIVLSPTSSVVPVVQQPIAENRPYLPSAAILALVVVAGYAAFGRRTVLVASTSMIILGLGLTVRRNRDYATEIGLWADTIEKCPGNDRAHYNIGVAYNHAGNVDAAAAEYQATLRINPNYTDALNNLGNILNEKGRPSEALPYLETAVRMRSNYVDAHYNLGNSYLKLNQPLAAQRQFEIVRRLDPKMAKAHNNLGVILHSQGKLTEARLDFEAAVRAKGDYADALANLGTVLVQLEHPLEEAVAYFETAIKADPTHRAARENLAKVFNTLGATSVEKGDLSAAQGYFEGAIRALPGDSGSHSNLGMTYLRANRPADAIRCFEEALRLQPDAPSARAGLIEAKARQGLRQ